MAKKKAIKKHGGPFLAAAVFCEGIMEGADKKISAFNISDGVEIWLSHDAPTDVPSKEHPLAFTQGLLLIFRSGDSPGTHKLNLMTEGPDGKRKKTYEKDIVLSDKPHGGLNLKTAITFSVFTAGLFWVDVLLDGKRLTRVPLNVAIGRLPPA